MSTVLITGAATGIGNLTAKALARAGHRVYATMRAPEGRNAPRAQELRDFAAAEGADIRVVELDVASQESADDAVHAVVADCGELDVVIHNAGHLLVGYVEAFTAEEIAHLIDVNTLGVQRLNRAALPHLRERGRGTLLYVGSTIPVTTIWVPTIPGSSSEARSGESGLKYGPSVCREVGGAAPGQLGVGRSG